jgi:hypothetical protein
VIRSRVRRASREYRFVDEWDVMAPREAVFHAISEARTYPRWWMPVYIDVEAQGGPAVGKETATGTHVRFDWRVFADKPLLRVLTPILRPAFRWNHAWAIARAREGLEPYARAWAEERRAVAV